MRRLKSVLSVLPGVVIACFPGRVDARGPTDAWLAPVEAGAEMPAASVAAVADGIDRAAGEAAAAVHRVGGSSATGCLDGACLEVRARAAQVGPDQTIAVELIGADGAVAARVEAVCDMCGLQELSTVAADTFLSAWREASMFQVAATGSLVVGGGPQGALVEIDGEPAGLLPFEAELPPGRHQVIVSRQGYFQRSTTAEIVEGESSELDLELVEIPPDLERRHRRLQIAGLSSLGGGLVLGGVGAALFVADGREYRGGCSGSNVDADGDCRQRWNSTPGAIVATTVGAAALVTGAVLVGIGTRRRQDAARDQKAARARLGPAGLRVDF